jgi:ribonucleoside-diphosphate reductase alpha chain
MCATMLATGARRGAMMATLRCDHPDIGEFIDAKRDPDTLAHFNLSVLVTDAFMRAVRDGHDWPLVFPGDGGARGRVPARELWHRLCRAAYDTAEPGVLFVDRINAANNLAYCERLSATNPCAEEPLPAYGACNLGSINLTQFVSRPFTPESQWDLGALAATAGCAVRFLDDIAEISRFPLDRQRDEYRRSRRIGLGITGLADALAMLTLRYDGSAARTAAARAMETIRDAAYETSAALAGERGSFASYRAGAYLETPFIRSLPAEIRAAIRRGGIRNSHLTAIAPAGTISLLARNVSSGIEPCVGLETLRRVTCRDGTQRSFQARSYAFDRWRSANGDSTALPPYFVEAAQVPAREHLLMQAALQPFVDSGVSKTVTLAHDFPPDAVAELLHAAYDLGLKGCTLYREGTRPAVIECRRPAAVLQDAGRGKTESGAGA